MRVKHAGGIVGLDVTQGLPRVEELFETRIPKNVAPISEVAGLVTVDELEKIITKFKTIERRFGGVN